LTSFQDSDEGCSLAHDEKPADPHFASIQHGIRSASGIAGNNSLKTLVLLAEDSRVLRDALERVLVKAGYAVLTAADGEAALFIARENSPDLILLDMMLPKLDGREVLRALKHDPVTANIPVIVLTGLGQQNAARHIREGASACFLKLDSLFECHSNQLLQTVETVLHGFPSAEPFTEALASVDRCG
jgi:CheY-like chemotaxis protein